MKNKNKDNMKQAAYEMFGVGSAPEEAKKEESVAPAKKAEPAPEAKKVSTAVSFLAPGTMLEGTLRSDGDVEVAGEFKGDITTSGTVVGRSVIQGNITATDLKLFGCSLTGDVVAENSVTISQDSTVFGNISAKEILLAGQVTGDLNICCDTVLESSAQINGTLVTNTISVAKGAVIKGSVEIKMVGSI